MDLYQLNSGSSYPAPGATAVLTNSLRIRVTDPDKNPLAGAKCRIAGTESPIYVSDANGIAKIPLTTWSQSAVDVEWEPADAEQTDPANRFYFQNTFQTSISNINDEACATRLTHLGFSGASLADQVSAYQKYFGREMTGVMSDIRNEMAAWHDGGDKPGSLTAGAGSGVSITQTTSANSPSASANDGTGCSKVSILLCNPDGNPIEQSQWYATLGGEELNGTTDNGRIEIENPNRHPTVQLKWNNQINSPEIFFEHEINLAINDGQTAIANRLHNLGYFGITLDDMLADFCEDFGYPPGTDNNLLFTKICEWHDGVSGIPADYA